MPEQKWQFEQDGLIINASRTNGRGTVAWRGVSDSRTPALFLRPVLRDLSEKMKGAEVTVDFTKLEYMNSATVSPLINFVKTLDGTLHAHPGPVRPDRLAANPPPVHARDRHDPAPHDGRQRALLAPHSARSVHFGGGGGRGPPGLRSKLGIPSAANDRAAA